jgi:hypothetical protein
MDNVTIVTYLLEYTDIAFPQMFLYMQPLVCMPLIAHTTHLYFIFKNKLNFNIVGALVTAPCSLGRNLQGTMNLFTGAYEKRWRDSVVWGCFRLLCVLILVGGLGVDL